VRSAGQLLLTAGLVCLLLVISQLFLKQSLQQVGPQPRRMFQLLFGLVRLPTFWLAVGSTGFGALLWLVLLRSAPVSVVYPLLSLSYVFMIPAARIAFGEPVTLPKLTGTGIICLGVFVVTRTIH